ncbi:MAG: hypothetical protein COU71_03050 [Parcubacteria group bacterium CG10_big_fil_rev_8_21_14_0_10_38_31]|nr:MAG: hypothetical protein COU71_03050 [Parcubacteria group bacterium CG10_big_fil_rev_8_21_14_0_10_38_31]
MIIPEILRVRSYELLKRNRRQAGELSYTVPSPTMYPYQWLWDSCFHAIVLTHFEPEEAKQEILSLLSRQFNNGMIPHMIYWDDHAFESTRRLKIDWGKTGTSSITQPPMIAYAIWRIFQKDGDMLFLKKIYPNLFHFYKYLLNERDPHERHLIGILNPDESGEDNSPRFDTLLDLPPTHTEEINYQKRMKLVEENKQCNFDAPFCMKNFFWVKDVPFNAIMVENLRCLSHIAEKLGHEYDAQYFNTEAERIATSMRALMDGGGLYLSTYGEDYRKIKVKTWAIFAPLFAKLLSQDEARVLVDKYLLDPKFFLANYSVPTVSRDEPSYNPEGFWRGPTWIASNWFIYKGLLQYGFTAEAQKIKDSSISLIEKSGFREQFNPETGEGLGAHDFTWGTLIVDMEES